MLATVNYNYIHTSKGSNNEKYTPAYGVEVLLEFLEPFREKVIWCPFDTVESEFVKILQKTGFQVIFSHIKYGQDFFTYEPEKWDLIVSNPPFTGKRYIMERALSFNKPFALLQPLPCLNDKYPKNLFHEQGKDLQILMFASRMTFKGQDKKINFSSAYFCWNFLPRQIIIRDFANRNQKKLLELIK